MQKSVFCSSPVVAMAFLAITCNPSLAQSSLSLSSASIMPGGTVTLNLTVSSPTGSEPASLQWTLTYPTATVTSLSVTAGAALISSGKSLSCVSNSGSYSCVATGMNNAKILNGSVATVSVSMSTTVGTTTIGVANALGASSSAAGVSITATGGSISVVAPLTISSLACVPNSLAPGGSSVCTASLNGMAGSGGVSVGLSSNTPAISVPTSVMIASGSSSATFTATAGTFTSNQSGTVTASISGSSASAAVSLIVPINLSSLNCAASALASNATTSCTVTLSTAAPSGGSTVALSSNSAILSVPASVTVPANATSAAFTATTGAIASNGNATISATLNGGSSTKTISLQAPVNLSSLQCAATSLVSNASTSCTITVSSASLTTATAVALSSNNSTLTVPASVSVPANSISATFTATTGAIASNGNATISASLNGAVSTTTISLQALANLSSVQCTPSTLSSNANSSCTVNISAAAPSGGTNIALSSSNVALTVPPSITVPAGSMSANFTASSGTITSNSIATITASLNGASSTATISLQAPAPVNLSSLQCTPTSLASNVSTACVVTLSSAAPTGGAAVIVSSTSTSLAVPASVMAAAGAVTATFTATAGSINNNQNAIITATLNGASITAIISLTSPGLTQPSVSIDSPTTNSAVTGTITISGWAIDNITTIGTAITGVQVQVDGNLVGNATYGLSRPDVCTTYPGRPGCPNVGYSYQFNTSSLSAGSHTITVVATDSDSTPQTASASVTVTVSAAGPAFIQQSAVLNGTANPSVISLPSASTNGNLLIVQVTQDNQRANVASITDNKGNVYQRAIAGRNWGATGTEVRSELWYAANIIAGGSPVTTTVKLSSKAKSFVQLYLSEYSGVASTPLDQVAYRSATGPFSGTFSSDAKTTTVANELVFGHCEMWTGTTSGGNGFTTHSTFDANIEESMNVISLGAYSASCGVNGSGPMIMMATFKAATGSTNAPALISSAGPQTLVTSRTDSNGESHAKILVGTPDRLQKEVLGALSCSPKVATAGTAVTCELRLTADVSSVVSGLESSSDSVRIPTSITSRPNQSNVSFVAWVDAMARQGSVDVTARVGNSEVHDTIQVIGAQRPVLAAPDTLSGRFGYPISFAVRASDPTDLPLTLTVDGLPEGATFDPIRGRFEWVPEASQVGNHPITFIATNTMNQSAAMQVAVNVGTELPVAYSGAQPSTNQKVAPHILGLTHANDKKLVSERDFTESAYPALINDEIVVWTTGVDPSAVGTMLVKFGDLPAHVESVEAGPEQGLYAVRVQVPMGTDFGKVPVDLRVTIPGGHEVSSNSALAVIEPGR